MSDKKEKPTITFQTGYIGTYLNIMEAKAFARKGQPLGDPKFSASFVIDPKSADFETLKAAVVNLLKENLPGKKLVAGRRMTQEEADAGAVEVNLPWRRGEDEVKRLTEKGGEFKDIYTGNMIVKASSKYRPLLDAIEKSAPNGILSFSTDEIIKAQGSKYFYSGAYFLPTFGLNFYAAKGRDPGGVSLYLNAMLFTKHGERLGGRKHNPAEAYKGYLGKISQEDPTAGAADVLDDEIPF